MPTRTRGNAKIGTRKASGETEAKETSALFEHLTTHHRSFAAVYFPAADPEDCHGMGENCHDRTRAMRRPGNLRGPIENLMLQAKTDEQMIPALLTRESPANAKQQDGLPAKYWFALIKGS